MLVRRPVLAAIHAALLFLMVPIAALAGETRVAVAANFTEPAKEIAARFEANTGHKAVLSFGSSGQFFAQIANGITLPVVAGIVLWLINTRLLPARYRNTRLHNLAGLSILMITIVLGIRSIILVLNSLLA